MHDKLFGVDKLSSRSTREARCAARNTLLVPPDRRELFFIISSLYLVFILDLTVDSWSASLLISKLPNRGAGASSQPLTTDLATIHRVHDYCSAFCLLARC